MISFAYYFCNLVDKEIEVTVTILPEGDILQYLPFDVDEILRKLSDMWDYVLNGQCFLAYLSQVLSYLELIAVYLLPVLLLLLLVPTIVKSVLLSPNTAHGEKTRSVRLFESKVLPKICYVKEHFGTFFELLMTTKVYKCIFVFIWLINFNVITILFEALAYYLYFAFSFDMLNLISIQIVKLLLDLLIMFSGAPVLFWLIVTYVIICKVRREIGYKRLNHRENLDRDLIGRQPLIMMFTGTMGTGKTTAVTSFSLSQEIRFREKAFELLFEIEGQYPNFAWIDFEDYIITSIKLGKVKNLTQCRALIKQCKELYEETGCDILLFDYNSKLYRTSFDDNLTDTDIWKALEDYACLYFIYIIQSSLLVANYAIRVDSVLDSVGNFPLWDNELFRNTPQESKLRSRRSHILDYDILRMGVRMLEDNPNRNTFEFGILSMSEFAKERGNQLTLQDVKKNDSRANQKNDLFIYSLKMARHKATIRGFPFITFIADEQREDSLNADTRELMNIMNIENKNPMELLMPMFFLEDLIHEWIYPRFVNFYALYRYNRGDMCFPMYVAHNVITVMHNRYQAIYNLYGCNVLDVSIRSGKEGSEAIKERIHLLHKKVYSDRFATDCYLGYYEPELLQASVGLDDYPEYSDTVPTLEEWHMQHSYFIADLEKVNNISEEKRNEK